MFIICELWSCDMNSTLGSVVPLAMFNIHPKDELAGCPSSFDPSSMYWDQKHNLLWCKVSNQLSYFSHLSCPKACPKSYPDKNPLLKNACTFGSRTILLPYTNFYVEVWTIFQIKLLHVEVLTNFWLKLLHIEVLTIFPDKTSPLTK